MTDGGVEYARAVLEKAYGEDMADELLRKAKQAELLVLIYPDGNYAVKELIIDGKPLREAIEAKQRAEQN